MRGVVFERAGAVRVGDLPEPRIEEPGDAVVEVTRSAICGSDLHPYHGRFPMNPGESLGHEAVGVVREVGEEVRRVAPGDRVIVAFGIACGSCWYCRRGQTSLCDRFRNLGFGEYGGGLAGTQAERVRVPMADVNLLEIPDGMDDERALFVGDILTTGFYGVSIAEPEAGDTVAVVGAGPVGFFCAQAALARGAGRVLLLDVEPSRLELAGRIGAVPVPVGGDVDVSRAVKAQTDGRGADVAIDAVGLVSAYETAVKVTRRGGRISVVGVYGPETTEIRLGHYWVRGLRVLFAGVCPVHAWWEHALAAVASGAIDPLPVISHRLPLEDAPSGYELFDRREATKVVLHP